MSKRPIVPPRGYKGLMDESKSVASLKRQGYIPRIWDRKEAKND